ncbi:hypothetical protein NA56DRAFT_666660 [Hyaloscypha hepaticicola]|uniref:Uncharacterized protein n=1 Tax=Hyaloscypha hepaticicola TaxID=2082293 RepID=A0A2J6PDI8_9HELO|nr:hypothetical protein NA56DRAFT_666660 [Hyaloscypha hepaticicola]
MPLLVPDLKIRNQGPWGFVHVMYNSIYGSLRKCFEFFWEKPIVTAVNSAFKIGIRIGATSNWHSFGDEPGLWEMYGMTGCTAVFIVSEKGFWAGHFWESSKQVNGGSAFLFRKSAGGKPQERQDDPDFKGVAVDIFNETPLAGVY